MKNNSFKNIVIALLTVIFISVNGAFALALPQSVKAVASKYITAMVIVCGFFVVMTIGLSIYNRFFVSKNIRYPQLDKDSLRTPKDKDEAILGFIMKNKD